MRLKKSTLAFGLFGFVIAGAFLWALWNFEMPEADIRPLTILAQANDAQLRAAGITLLEDGIKTQLQPEQIKRLAVMMSAAGKTPRLENKWGHPYIVWVLKRPDKTRASGYHYEWIFYSVGRDGIFGNKDDVSV